MCLLGDVVPGLMFMFGMRLCGALWGFVEGRWFAGLYDLIDWMDGLESLSLVPG